MGLFGGGTKTEVKVLNPNALKTKNYAMDTYRNALGKFQEFADESPEFVKGQINREKAAANAANNDAQRRMKDMITRRGLGNSSIGLGQLNAMNKQTSNQIASIGASLGERMRAERGKSLGQLLGATSPGMGINVERTAQQKKKGGLGGLGTIIGTGAGAYFGGPQGAQVGAGIGSMFD